MTIKIVHATSDAPIKQVHVGNVTDTDKSGYLGLILNVNKNGKAIRIALRDGSQRVNVLRSEIPQLIEALQALDKKGVKTSVNDVEYDKVA